MSMIKNTPDEALAAYLKTGRGFVGTSVIETAHCAFKRGFEFALKQNAGQAVDMPVPTGDALDLMERQGGSFIKALAHCYLMADPENKRRLRIAMHDWFANYEARAAIAEATGSQS